MKANELMIGDWVRNDLGEIQRVEEIRQEDVMLSYNDYYSYDEIEPIPLTPEILEKNGWENSVPDVWQKEYGGFVFYWGNGTGRFGMDDFRHLQEQWTMHLRIKYTHQLQSALRLCGIEHEIKL